MYTCTSYRKEKDFERTTLEDDLILFTKKVFSECLFWVVYQLLESWNYASKHFIHFDAKRT